MLASIVAVAVTALMPLATWPGHDAQPVPGVIDTAPSLVAAPLPPTLAPPIYVDPDTPPPCAETWCLHVGAAMAARDRGDLPAMVHELAGAYGMEAWEPWAVATITCESGWNPDATDGWYVGLTQADPTLFPPRAAAAGFPGYTPQDPVANVGTMFSMVRAKVQGGDPRPWTDWPVCGANGWQP